MIGYKKRYTEFFSTGDYGVAWLISKKIKRQQSTRKGFTSALSWQAQDEATIEHLREAVMTNSYNENKEIVELVDAFQRVIDGPLILRQKNKKLGVNPKRQHWPLIIENHFGRELPLSINARYCGLQSTLRSRQVEYIQGTLVDLVLSNPLDQYNFAGTEAIYAMEILKEKRKKAMSKDSITRANIAFNLYHSSELGDMSLRVQELLAMLREDYEMDSFTDVEDVLLLARMLQVDCDLTRLTGNTSTLTALYVAFNNIIKSIETIKTYRPITYKHMIDVLAGSNSHKMEAFHLLATIL